MATRDRLTPWLAVTLLLAAFLGSCEHSVVTLPVSIPFQQVGFQPGERGDAGTHFVGVTLGQTPNDQAERDLTNIGRNLCRDKTVCFVHYWADLASAARSLPMTDLQADAQIASYNKNTNTGSDGLVCHPFGSPGDQCAKSGQGPTAQNRWEMFVNDDRKIATTTSNGWTLFVHRVHNRAEVLLSIAAPNDQGWVIDEDRPPLLFLDGVENDWFAQGRAYDQLSRRLLPAKDLANPGYGTSDRGVSTTIWHGNPKEGEGMGGALGELLVASSLRIVIFVKPFQVIDLNFSLQGAREAIQAAGLDQKVGTARSRLGAAR